MALFLSGCAVQGQDARLAAAEPNKSTYDALISAGDAKMQAGDFPAAVELYRNAYNVDQDASEPLRLMGRALVAGGAPEEATEAYRAALFRDAKDVEARRGLGNALVAMDEPALAIPHYRIVLENASSDFRGYLGLGAAYDLLGQHQAAQAVYESGLSETPGNTDLTHNLGFSLVLSGEMDRGIELLRSVVAGPEAGAQQRQTLAMALILNGNEEEARNIAALDLAPTEVERTISYFRTLQGLEDPAQRLEAIRAYLGS